MTKSKNMYLAIAVMLLASVSANAGLITVSTGDLGNNVIDDAGDFLWAPVLASPSGLGPNILTVTYGLWNSPDVNIDLIVNGNNVGSFLADSGYISPGPEMFSIDVGAYLLNGVNSIFFTGYSANSGDYVIGQVDLTYDSVMVPVPATVALFGIGLVGMGLARRKLKI